MAKIQFEDKVALNENANIPDINKCKATDMNEIKSVVNGNDDEFIQYKMSDTYSTDEVKTNKKWIDGKPIYRKVIDTGTLPDSVGKKIPHNISNVNQIINIKGYAYRSSDNICLPLPSATYDNTAISCYADRTHITIVTYTNRTSFKTSYVTLEYTKTTD